MMKKTKERLWRFSAFTITTLLATGCDLQSKTWAEGRLLELPERTLESGFALLDFSLAHNRGTAFSMVMDLGNARTVLAILAFFLVIGMCAWVVFSKGHRFEAISLGLMAGGALGNGYDRLFRITPQGDTGVVDFIRIHYPWGGSWPTFNIADVLVLVGAVAYMLLVIFAPSTEADEPQAT